MSYDLRLVGEEVSVPCRACKGEGAVTLRPEYGDYNMTSNVAPMWRAAGADLAEFHGKRAKDCIPGLDTAVAAMASDPARFEAMNPPNGWGSYTGCLAFLRELRQQFAEHPDATVDVWL